MRKPSSSEEAEAISILRRQQNPGEFPTATASGQTARLHGRYATLALTVRNPQLVATGNPAAPAGTGATITPLTTPRLLCFHWEIEFMQEFADATAHGDFWRVRIPLTQDWQGRVQGYLNRSATSWLAAISNNKTDAGGTTNTTGSDPQLLTLTCYSDAGTNIILQGDCYAQRGRVMAPQAMVTQEIELVSAFVPATMMVGYA